MPTRPQRPNGSLAEHAAFVRRAMSEPGLVGAVAPSSFVLAREMARIVPTEARARVGAAASGSGPVVPDDRAGPVVVEIGPGTGALSGAITQRLPADSRHVAIEVDGGMVRHLQESRPDIQVIQGDAVHLRELLGQCGLTRVDAVVSGLPWSIFSERAQHDILSQVAAVLAPSGAFATFGYVHAMGMASARQFRRQLDGVFDEVVTSRTVWRNLPPARIYFCRRPRD